MTQVPKGRVNPTKAFGQPWTRRSGRFAFKVSASVRSALRHSRTNRASRVLEMQMRGEGEPELIWVQVLNSISQDHHYPRT